MHECPECYQACDCDGEDIWHDFNSSSVENCIHDCEDYEEDDLMPDNETNPIDLLISDGIAKNQFQAAHIANGLKLWDLTTDEDRLPRARLYRDWRNAKIYGPKDTASCYIKAIEGVPVPQLAMIPEAMHSMEDE